MNKGKLIVIDGTDGSGKKTQTDLLVEHLERDAYRGFLKPRRFKVRTGDFPQYGKKSARLVERYLRGEFGEPKEIGYAASIFYALDREAAAPEISRWLEKGDIVVSNRYVSANMGHQVGKVAPEDRDRVLSWLEKLEYDKMGIPRPDLQILLYADPEIAQKLVDKKGYRDYVDGQKRDIHEADLNHLKDASEAYLYCAKKFDWDIVDCTSGGKMRSVEDIHNEVYEIVKSRIDVVLS